MSTYIGVRTHASEVRAAHKSRIAATNAARLAAAGLALMLSVGFSGGAHAAEGPPKKQSDPNDAAVQAAEMVQVCHLKDGRYITVAPEAAERGHAEGHDDATGEPCAVESGTEESGTDESESGSDETGTQGSGTEESESGSDETGTQGSGAEGSGTEESETGEQGADASETAGGESESDESGTDAQGAGEQSGSDEQDAAEQRTEESGAEGSGTGEQEGDESETGSGESGSEGSGSDEEGADEVGPVVLTPLPDQDTRVEQPTKPTKPVQSGGDGDTRGEVLGVEIDSSGTDKDRATGRGKTGKGASESSGHEVRSADAPGFRDEILPAATGTANRPAARVLPQTGAAANMALQAGAGLALLLGGLFTLAGRRRQDDC